MTQQRTFANLMVRATAPKLISALVTVGVFYGLVFSALFGLSNVRRLVGQVLAVTACTIMLWLSWRRHLGWRQILRSLAFWIAVTLVVGANAIEML